MNTEKLFDSEDSETEEENSILEKGDTQPSFIENLPLHEYLDLNSKFDVSHVLKSDDNKTHSLMVQITESKLEEEKVKEASLDLVCLIDTSGSMDGFKLSQVKQTLLFLLDLLKPEDRLAIVGFSSEANIYNSLRLVDQENKSGRLLQSIESLTADGGTNLMEGLKKSVKILKNRKTKNQMSSIFLLSDGNDNYGLKGLDSLLAHESVNDIVINTFGYGDDYDPNLLEKIATARKGNFYYIQDLGRVDEAFVDCLGLLSSTIGRQASVKVKLLPNPLFKEISFSNCYGPAWKGISSTERVIDLGGVFLGMDKSFVADITLDSTGIDWTGDFPRDTLIAEVTFEVKNISSNTKEMTSDSDKFTLQADLSVGAALNTDNITITRDSEVEKQLLRVTGAELMSKAQDYVQSSKFDKLEESLLKFQNRISKNYTKSSLDPLYADLNNHIQKGFSFSKKHKAAPKVSFGDKAQMVNYWHQNTNSLYQQQSIPQLVSPSALPLFQNNRQRRYIGRLNELKMNCE